MNIVIDYFSTIDQILLLWGSGLGLVLFAAVLRHSWDEVTSSKLPVITNSALQIAIILAVFLLLSCQNDSRETHLNDANIITHQSPVMLLADTTRGTLFRCIEFNPQTMKTHITDTLFVQVSGDSIAATAFRKKVAQQPPAFRRAAKRCLADAGISADTARSGASIFYAVPLSDKKYATVTNIDENTPMFQETDKLPGKDLALQVKNDEEPGSLYGILMHGDPKKPLPNVKIVLRDTDTWSETNEEGEFYLDDLPSGTQQFEVNYLGHTIGILTMKIN